MKTIKMMIFALSAISLLALTPMTADAHRWHGGGYWSYGFYGALWGAAWPGPWYYGYYPRSYYGYPYSDPYNQTVVIVPQTTQSVQTAAPIAAPPQFWYFCESTKTYYPYVQSCDRDWKMVPVTPSVPPAK